MIRREEVYRDMEDTFGFVPSYFKQIPEGYLAEEWDLWKRTEMGETKIPNKYKELIGLAVSGATKCRYCTLFHTEAAKLHGATDEEIEEAARMAKLTTGWSTYIQSLQIDYDQFKDEVRRAVEFVKSGKGERVRTSV